ncbi:MAG: ABC transporter ATP-binding protein [Austwickia sp.]|nr:ABC transporter ATP-binding protein [Actinomycetota bacterium]MCO5310606.1 ABC transporter ATP-binding protein [Austwickia sp.]
MADLLRTAGLTRDFGGGAGVFEVSIAVPQRGCYALIGPNGAGKTTLFTLLTGIDRPDAGSISWAPDGDAIAYCPDTPAFEPWLTAAEVLAQSATLAGRARPRGPAHAPREALARCGLTPVADRRVGAFSRGMTQRLGIAAALVVPAQLLILDEPTSALDPTGRHEIRALIRTLAADRAVLLSSHSLSEVEKVAEVVGVLRAGRLIAQAPLSELIRAALQPRWTLRTEPGVDLAVASRTLAAQPGVTAAAPAGAATLTVSFADLATGARLLAPTLATAGIPLVSAQPDGGDLDAAFAAILERAR